MIILEQILYVGGYTHDIETDESTGGSGIMIYAFDKETGHLQLLDTVEAGKNPAWLALGRDSLYAANEYEGGGGVTAFRFQDGYKLKKLNSIQVHTSNTCHMALDQKNRRLYAANIFGKSFMTIPLKPDGALGESAHVTYHDGSSTHPRQTKA